MFNHAVVKIGILWYNIGRKRRIMKHSCNTAYLYNKGEYTFFKMGTQVIKFATSPYLVRYTKIKEYDRGYIVVDAEYRNRDNKDKTYIDEDYIDMEYVFNELGIDTSILDNVKDVQIYS